MKKLAAVVVPIAAVLLLAVFSGAAFAGDHGSQAGEKPSSTTQHNTDCSTGGGKDGSATCSSTTSSKPDASKRYGNGKTAAQIANDRGAPAGTGLHGPGNSQPHKVTACGKPDNKSGGVDVHAVKSYDSSSCKSSTHDHGKTTTTTKTTEQEHGKVYICHATGSATNPFVLIHVSVNAEWAHTHHQDGRDIVLGDQPGPCPTGQVNGTTSTATTTTATTTTVATTTAATTTAATTTAATTTAATTTTATTTTTAAAAVSPGSPSAPGGVLGQTKTIAAPAATAGHAPGGVLGAVSRIGRTATSGTLPFTGLRLWIVELFALGLIGLGVATRLVARRNGA